MTDTTSTPHAPAPARPPHEAAFFRWIRGLGVVRGNRWVGGVCGGMAARMGIDPLIVRGMFVVAALIGFPALVVYLACWILLPDALGRIPLQQLARRPIGPFVITLGAVVLALFALTALGSWYRGDGTGWWLFGGWWWSMLGLNGFGGFVSALFGLALVAGVIVLAVRWSAHSNSARPVAPDAGFAPTRPDAPDAAGAASAAGVGTPAPADVSGTSGAWGGPDAAADLAAASPLSPEASPEEVAHWRVRQEEWRTQYDAWRRQQADADAAAKQQIRREREEQGRAFALAAQQRAEERRRTKPRTSGLYVLGVLGVALIGGAITALTTAHLGATIASGAALLVAAIVCATGMVVAGLLRRRSGFLTFVSGVLLTVGLVVGYLGVIVPDGLDLTVSTASDAPQSFRQAVGSTMVEVVPSDAPGAGVRIEKYAGAVEVHLEPGAVAAVDATVGDGQVYLQRLGADGASTPMVEVKRSGSTPTGPTYRWTNATTKTPAATPVQITLDHGSVIIYEQEQGK